jgi:hypothetical protein
MEMEESSFLLITITTRYAADQEEQTQSRYDKTISWPSGMSDSRKVSTRMQEIRFGLADRPPSNGLRNVRVVKRRFCRDFPCIP